MVPPSCRGVFPHTQVNSPPTHTAFDTPRGLLRFVARLRELCGGKPAGIKLAIGRKSEFITICKAMRETGIRVDFITVDGGEGGTGAAPLEYSNSIGMPLREALAFVADCLTGFGLRQDIRIIASGKILTAFHVVKNIALGADLCNSARGMMLALGCVYSLVCNTNRCPTGIATQDPRLGGPLPHRPPESFAYLSAHRPVRDQALRSDISLSGDGGPALGRGAGPVPADHGGGLCRCLCATRLPDPHPRRGKPRFPRFAEGLLDGNPDFVCYAESYGAQGHRVDSAAGLIPLLEHCFDTPGVHLVEVPVDYSDNDRILNRDIKQESRRI